MSYCELIQELELENSILAVTRIKASNEQAAHFSHHCLFQSLDRVLKGESIILKPGVCGCKGFDCNAGFIDEMPSIPGGYGLFLSYGAGKGYRAGERLKCNPNVAESFFANLPHHVMEDFNALRLEPYKESMGSDLVICFVTPDQLSALAFLYAFRHPKYDNIIAATTSGCASLFRVPLAELNKDNPRAVIGNMDVTSRPYMDEALFSFTVTSQAFSSMLIDTENCFFHSPYWNLLRDRIHRNKTKVT